MKNVLVTGASGFIGKSVINRLDEINDVHIYAISRRDITSSKKNIDYISADVMKTNSFEYVFEKNKIDCVIHLAAITEHNDIVGNKANTLMINLHGTYNVLDAFNKYCRDAQFIYASTGKVYGKTNEMPISEKAECHPTNILGKSKYMTEQLIDYCAIPGNKYLICRIFNVYGSGQKPNFIFPTILNQISDKEMVLGNISDKRDYLYLEDLVDAIVRCIFAKNRFDDFDIVNIGSGKAYSVKDIIKIIEGYLDRKIAIRIDDERLRKDETNLEYCTNQKLISVTNWKPKYSMQEGIRELLLMEKLL